MRWVLSNGNSETGIVTELLHPPSRNTPKIKSPLNTIVCRVVTVDSAYSLA